MSYLTYNASLEICSIIVLNITFDVIVFFHITQYSYYFLPYAPFWIIAFMHIVNIVS